MQKEESVLPTKKGLMMSIPEWRILAASLPGLSQAVEEKDLTYKVSLAEKRQATVTDFIKGTISVDVREYYGAGEECKPSPKGVMLKEPVFKVFSGSAILAFGHTLREVQPTARLQI